MRNTKETFTPIVIGALVTVTPGIVGFKNKRTRSDHPN